MATVAQRVQSIIAEYIRVPIASVTPDADIIEDLGVDELDSIELLMVIEEELGIVIPDEVQKDIYTVGDVIRAAEQGTVSTQSSGT